MYKQQIPQQKKTGCLGCLLKGCLISFLCFVILFSVSVFFSINQVKKNKVIIHMVSDGWGEITLKKIVKTFQHDIKIVSADRNRQVFVLKNIKTGNTLTVTKYGITLGDGLNSIEQSISTPSQNRDNQEENHINPDQILPDIFFNTDTTNEKPPFDWIIFYPNSKVTSRINMSNSDRSFGTYKLTTIATPQEIYNYYSQKLVAKGFEVKAEKQDKMLGGGIRISCLKNNTTSVIIAVKRRKDTQEITLEYEKKTH